MDTLNDHHDFQNFISQIIKIPIFGEFNFEDLSDEMKLKVSENVCSSLMKYQNKYMLNKKINNIKMESNYNANHNKYHKSIYISGGTIGSDHQKSIEKLDLSNHQYTLVGNLNRPRACNSGSTIFAKDKIYIFGGNDHTNSYEVFCTKQNKIICVNEIGTSGGSSISTCYDGERYIYLLGGYQNNQTQMRIDRFDTVTDQCINYSQMNIPRYYCWSFYTGDGIFTIGGTYKMGLNNSYSIIMVVEYFSIKDKRSYNYMSMDILERVEGACFDGKDTIYFITNSQFLKLSLSRKEVVILPNLNLYGRFGLSLIFTQVAENESRVYLIGGSSENDNYFQIEKRKWKSFKGKSTRTCFQGATVN